jgi:hypothetical protein
MSELSNDTAIAQAESLLISYSFDLKNSKAAQLIDEWKQKYQPIWIRLAVIEALYLGRYKAVSVEQILNVWSRRGNPNFHFSLDFETLICRNLPQRKDKKVDIYSKPKEIIKEKKPCETVKEINLPPRVISRSIDKFVPVAEPTYFYQKLKLLGEQGQVND